MSNDLFTRLRSVGSKESVMHSQMLKESAFFQPKDAAPTDIPIINLALSGKIDGGLTSGLTFLAGESKSFKTLLGLMLVKAYMKKHKDAMCIFYDSEYGSTPEYFESIGIDTSRILHIPLEHVEQLKFDIVQKLKEIKKNDKVIIFIDSVGNLASVKEVEDAEEGKSVADMSRAKAFKSLWRIVTPHLTTKDIPLVAVNHVYKEIGLYPKDIVSGGCLLKGTKIVMFDGELKNIEDVKAGDMVKTLDGIKLVTNSWNPDTLVEGEPECFEIEFEDGYKVVCSENHKFLINGEWIEAKNLKKGLNVDVLADE